MLRSMLAAAVLFSATQAFAAKTKTYQVTGPVLAVDADSITVQKGKEKWEIARDADTKGEMPKVGDKVTIEYRMTAASIEAKGAAKGEKAGKSEKAEKSEKGQKGAEKGASDKAGGAATP